MTSTVASPTNAETFPRQYARTRRFSLGEPRGFHVTTDEQRVLFLRSGDGGDPVQSLWMLERGETGEWTERLLVNPLTILGSGDADDLPPEERARRERLREQANGITAFDVATTGDLAVFALSGGLYLVAIASGEHRHLATEAGAFDPHLSPDGNFVAYVADRGLHVVGTRPGGRSSVLVRDTNEGVSWGTADFIAAEELNRQRGYWWSPDSKHILAARVDEGPVNTWWIADPSNPSATPRPHRYPAAGTANAIVQLAIIGVDATTRVDVDWARPQAGVWAHDSWPYLVTAAWSEHGCTAVLLNRAQTDQVVVDLDPASGALRELQRTVDDTWVELCPGTPVRLRDDRLVVTRQGHLSASVAEGDPDAEVAEGDPDADPEQTQYLAIRHPDGSDSPLTPPNMQVRRVVHADESRAFVTVTASRQLDTAFAGLAIPADPGASSLVVVPFDGSPISLLAGGPDIGSHDALAVGRTLSVIRSSSPNRTRADIRLTVGSTTALLVRNHAEVAMVNPKPIFFRAGPRAIPCVLFMPSTSPTAAPGSLPVLMDPYGGPHAQRVVQSRNAHTTSQWFADQGFAVLVVDGRGTPGLGPLYEKACRNDFTVGVVDDQVTGLHEAAARFPQLDLNHVAIRGWSFGGFLAAMAVLERPDVFHAAIAGAPVTEWRLYDTGYTERYLGDPNTQPDVYDANSVITRAHKLSRPLMLIHGLADDNVVCAHTLQLSGALLAHGKPHEVLPLSNVTHMTPQEEVAENLLKLQIEFLKRSLAIQT